MCRQSSITTYLPGLEQGAKSWVLEMGLGLRWE